MNELRLLFDNSAAKGNYMVQVAPAAGNPSAPIPFKPFLSDADYEDLRWYLEDFMDLPDGGAVVRAHRVEQELESW